MSKKPKFCIVSTQRSGSTWFVSLLNSHPQLKVLLGGDPFLARSGLIDGDLPYYFEYRKHHNTLRPWLAFNYLDTLDLETYEAGPHDMLGFKFMYNHIRRNPEVFIKLIADKYRVIHLARRNILDIIISTEIANQTGVFHIKDSSKNKIRNVTLDTSSLIKKIDRFERGYQLAKLFLKIIPIPTLEVTYETLASNTQETMVVVADFLQVDSKSAVFNSIFKRVNPSSYEDKIVNFKQVSETLKNSKYAHFIENI